MQRYTTINVIFSVSIIEMTFKKVVLNCNVKLANFRLWSKNNELNGAIKSWHTSLPSLLL